MDQSFQLSLGQLKRLAAVADMPAWVALSYTNN